MPWCWSVQTLRHWCQSVSGPNCLGSDVSVSRTVHICVDVASHGSSTCCMTTWLAGLRGGTANKRLCRLAAPWTSGPRTSGPEEKAAIVSVCCPPSTIWCSSETTTGRNTETMLLNSPVTLVYRCLDKTRQDNECRRAQVYPLCLHQYTIHAYHFIQLHTNW